MRRSVLLTLAGLLAAGLAVALVWFEPWRLATSGESDEAVPGAADVYVVDDNPAPRSQEAEDLEAALRGERTFVRGVKEAARATRAEQARDAQKREDDEERALQEEQDDDAGPTVVLAAGDFVDAEHATSGRARVVERADGRRFLRIEDLDSSDGPDLHVWVTDQPSGGGWGSYDDGRFVRLGELEATHGNMSYEVPAEADLAGMTSVVIWCDPFDVAFGTAPISL